jgi:hypothetical protein
MGKQADGTPRCKCNACKKKPSKLNTKNSGATPQTNQLIVKMSLNGSGIRNISRVLDVSINTVLTVLKKQRYQTNINPKYANLTGSLTIRLEMDEMWGRVYCKKSLCWLWHAVNYDKGDIVAYVFGTRKSEVLKSSGSC